MYQQVNYLTDGGNIATTYVNWMTMHPLVHKLSFLQTDHQGSY